MAHPELTPQLALLEEAVTVLFCQVDDIYYRLNPKGRSYETLKELSDSEVITLALFQQLRGVESERSFFVPSSFLLARGCPLLLAPVSWGRRPSSLLVAPASAQPQGLPGALAARHLARVGRRSRNPHHRLDPAFGFASTPSSSRLRL
jgi:hypothetical protein